MKKTKRFLAHYTWEEDIKMETFIVYKHDLSDLTEMISDFDEWISNTNHELFKKFLIETRNELLDLKNFIELNATLA